MVLIGPYHCGFRPGKVTIDQMFALRQILEKRHENRDKTHHLFVNFKAAFDSPVRGRVYARMSAKMGLAVNEGKTKNMLPTSGVVPRMGSQITANSCNFHVVKEFIYLGTTINTNNDVSLEVKRSIGN